MLEVKLIPLAGKDVVQVDKAIFHIGREDSCDFQLYNAQVSRQHCDLVIDEKSVRVRDLGSRNGTYVNGERVWGEMELHNQDTLAIAPLLFTVSIRESRKPNLLERLRRRETVGTK